MLASGEESSWLVLSSVRALPLTSVVPRGTITSQHARPRGPLGRTGGTTRGGGPAAVPVAAGVVTAVPVAGGVIAGRAAAGPGAAGAAAGERGVAAGEAWLGRLAARLAPGGAPQPSPGASAAVWTSKATAPVPSAPVRANGTSLVVLASKNSDRAASVRLPVTERNGTNRIWLGCWGLSVSSGSVMV